MTEEDGHEPAMDTAPTPAADGSTDPAGPHGDDSGLSPSDAFQRLGNAHRTRILRTLAADEPRRFSELFRASDVDTSAGFAYHLGELDGRFVRQRPDDRYELTGAGRRVARAIRAGTYTERVDRAPIELDENCPICGRPALEAAVADSVTEVACRSCETPLLALSLPPRGYASHDPAGLPRAIDSYHRHRIGTFSDGVCPDCGGAVDATAETCDDPLEPEEEDRQTDPVRIRFACTVCESSIACPVSLAVLDHPAVVGFYRDHGERIADRPLWNVGTEWRERLLSRDPWCIRVRTRLDDEDLLLYVAGNGTVVEHERAGPDDEPPARAGSARPTTETTGSNGGSDGAADPADDDGALA